MFIAVTCMSEYSIFCLFLISLFSLSDSREDTSLFVCLAVNVSSGNAISLHEFPCDTNLTPLCEHGIYKYFY